MSKKMTSRVLILVLVALIFSTQVFASTGLLRVGSRGSAVADLQNKLNALGYNAGTADGIFGSRTRTAVTNFQKANGLAADGIVGPATMAKLNGGAAPTKPADPKPEDPKPQTPPATGGPAPITMTLRQGSRNAQVKILQEKLNSLGFSAGKADGIFGSGTRAAVIAFQRANGLAADGIVGPASIAKLYPPTSTPQPETPKPEEPKPEQPKPEQPKPEQPKPETPPANTPAPITQTLRQGSRGEQVKILQNKLNSLGFNAGTADGIFGSGTRAAVIAFQRANGLAADGIVGPASIAKLYPPVTQPKPEEPKPETPKPEEPKPEEPKPNPDTGFKQFNGVPGQLAGKTIILDAGHGGSDTGASRNGIHEKNFNLDMALRLERMLKQAGANVLMTRRTDTYSYLFYRSAFVNKYIVDLELGKQEALSKELVAQESKATTDLANAKAELETKAGEKAKTEGSIATLNGEITQKQGELNQLKSDITDINKELEENIADRDEIQGLIDAIEGKKAEITKLAEEFSKNKKPLEDELVIKSQIPDDESEEDEIIREARITELEDLIAKLGEQFNKNKKTLEDEQVALEGQLPENYQSELSRLNQAIKPLQDNLNTKQKSFDDAKKVLDGKVTERNSLETLISSINNQITKLKADIPALEKTIADLKPQIAATAAQVTSLKGKSSLLQNNIANPSQGSRIWIYQPSSTAGNKNIVNNDLKEVFELTKQGYDSNMVFIAIHCNATASQTTTSSGVQVYYRDNRTDSTYGVNSHYYQGYDVSKRLKLANSMLKNTRENTNFKGRWTTPFVKDFHVLREQNLPSVLMEIGFVNNPEDVKLLQQKQTMENAAKGMYLGLVEYFK